MAGPLGDPSKSSVICSLFSLEVNGLHGGRGASCKEGAVDNGHEERPDDFSALLQCTSSKQQLPDSRERGAVAPSDKDNTHWRRLQTRVYPQRRVRARARDDLVLGPTSTLPTADECLLRVLASFPPPARQA